MCEVEIVPAFGHDPGWVSASPLTASGIPQGQQAWVCWPDGKSEAKESNMVVLGQIPPNLETGKMWFETIRKLRAATERWQQAVAEMKLIDPESMMGGHEQQDCAFSLMDDVLGDGFSSYDFGIGEEGWYDLNEEVIRALITTGEEE